MLSALRIQNFAIIEDIKLNFQPGLIILTGETGAGKSILVDALEAVVGGHVDTSAIRMGFEKAFIEAEFSFESPAANPVLEILQNEELLEDSTQLFLSREIRSSGRHVARINGRVVNSSLLREVGEKLIDIHGQSEHLSLLKVSQHLHLLDNFAKTEPLLNQYKKVYQKLIEIQHELERLHQLEQESARRLDLLNYQLNEIRAAKLNPEEESSLLAERTRLANAENIANLIQQALFLLDEETPDNPPIINQLGNLMDLMNNLVRFDPATATFIEQVNEIFEIATDLTHQLRNYSEAIEFNPKRLDQLEERLNLIHILKRKYGNTIEAILAYADKIQSELDEISNSTERIDELTEQRQITLAELKTIGLKLSQLRHQQSDLLAEAVEKELHELHMPKAQFQVQFQNILGENSLILENGQEIAFNHNGFEQIEFLIAPNPGEGFKPLVKIASGGETSRLMLALKNVLASADQIPVLVFDEIDQGIGGKVGLIVGKKLRQLSHLHQVFCITHLPQLAIYGNQHFSVSKRIQGSRTLTEVEEINQERRIQEIASMFGEVNASTVESARNLLLSVQEQD
ncbi:MAG: DNA repair protein RecN [Anaerolineales bacterium]